MRRDPQRKLERVRFSNEGRSPLLMWELRVKPPVPSPECTGTPSPWRRVHKCLTLWTPGMGLFYSLSCRVILLYPTFTSLQWVRRKLFF